MELQRITTDELPPSGLQYILRENEVHSAEDGALQVHTVLELDRVIKDPIFAVGHELFTAAQLEAAHGASFEGLGLSPTDLFDRLEVGIFSRDAEDRYKGVINSPSIYSAIQVKEDFGVKKQSDAEYKVLETTSYKTHVRARQSPTAFVRTNVYVAGQRWTDFLAALPMLRTVRRVVDKCLLTGGELPPMVRPIVNARMLEYRKDPQ